MSNAVVVHVIIILIFSSILNSSDSDLDSTLWSPDLSVDEPFLMYDETDTKYHDETMDAASVYSVECLSCHDGVSATNAIVTLPTDDNTTQSNYASSLNEMGNHPVSIEYIEGKAGLRPINTQLMGTWKGALYISDLLVDGKVECSSCHEPHGSNPDVDTLRNENIGSELCSSCHNK